MILVDSSAWIEFERGTDSKAHLALRHAVASESELATTGFVMLEVLAGGRDERESANLRRMLGYCRLIPAEEPTDHETAAALYRACRRAGTTIRRLPDCLIAAIAIRADVPVLHRDADFDAIARHSDLRIA